ncbi:MAG: TIM barrel protein [Gemmatimonadota bacterium]
MELRLACADFTFPLLPHEDSLRLIGMLGLEGADIGLFEGRSHLWPSREFADTAGAARRLKARLEDRGLTAADVFLQMDNDFAPYAVNQPDAARRARAREWYLHTLDYAAGCGCRHVTVLPGVHFEAEPLEASLARAADELGWRVDQARRRSLVLGVEAHVGSIAPDPERAEDLVRRVAGLTLTLDYTHFTRAGVRDGEVERLVPHASHFHARGARPGRLQTSFRDSAIDYGRVYQLLGESGYRGWLGIEYVWIDWEHCNECDNVSETIQFRDFFRGLSAQRT